MLVNLTSVLRPVQIARIDDGPLLVVNRDLVNAVGYGPSDVAGANPNEYSIVDALGSVTLDGRSDIFAFPLTGSAVLDVVPGAGNWTPSPAMAAQQINALGLAKDATLGSPAQDPTSQTIAGHVSGVQIAGGLQAVAQRLVGPGTYTLLNGKAYIYAAWIAWSFGSFTAYTVTQQSEANIYIVSSNQPILSAAARLPQANLVVSGANSIALPGLILAAGDSINLFLPPTPTNTTQTASAGLVYSTTAPP